MSNKEVPKEIQEKIKFEANRRFANMDSDNNADDKLLIAMFPDAASFGYSLALEQLEEKQKEIGLAEIELRQKKELLSSCESVLISRDKEITRLKGLIGEAWHQSLINCEIENGAFEGEGHYIHLREFKKLNNL
jgi:hypothetical protein